MDDPRSRASDVNSNSLLGLDVATNRDIIGITLANLIVSDFSTIQPSQPLEQFFVTKIGNVYCSGFTGNVLRERITG